MAGGLRHLGKGKGRDHHRIGEVLPAGIEIAALQLVLVGKGQRMDNEIDAGPVTGKPVEGAGNSTLMRHITFHHQIGSD